MSEQEEKNSKLSEKKINIIIAALAVGGMLISFIGQAVMKIELVVFGVLLGFSCLIPFAYGYMKKLKVLFITAIVFMEVFMISVCFFGDVIWQAIRPAPIVCELTEEEKQWLKSYADEDRIESGELWVSERLELAKGRFGLSELEAKYPGYKFKILSLEYGIAFSIFNLKEVTTGYGCNMYVSELEDETFESKDNFYNYFLNEKYAEYYKNLLEDEFEKIACIRCEFTYVEGREYDINISPEDFVSGKLESYPYVNICVSAIGMTEEQCKEYAEKMQTAIEKIDLEGIYNIRFWNMTAEELLTLDTYEGLIYRNTYYWTEKVRQERYGK